MTDWDTADLLALLDGTSHDELTVETDAQRFTFRRVRDDQWVQEVTTLRSPVLLAGSIADATPAKAQAVRAQDGMVDVCAPLPGIFYRAPKPGAAPFVELGTQVSGDTVVGVIETMKLMNSVAAGAGGDIAEICVENGTPIEAGDIIMRVQPR